MAVTLLTADSLAVPLAENMNTLQKHEVFILNIATAYDGSQENLILSTTSGYQDTKHKFTHTVAHH
jgi:hypothetical protein